MADAIHDENRVKVLMALSYIDCTTLVPIQVNSSNGGMEIDSTHTLLCTPSTVGPRDSNHHIVVMGVDSVTGDTIPLFADPATGAVLVDGI